jgi:hypothetical protein
VSRPQLKRGSLGRIRCDMRERQIVGFERDAAGDWVARLECGHDQHVRHEPPLASRPWVLNDAGRRAHLGSVLQCTRCASDAP